MSANRNEYKKDAFADEVKIDSSQSAALVAPILRSESESIFIYYIQFPDLFDVVFEFLHQGDIHQMNRALVGLYKLHFQLPPDSTPNAPMELFLQRLFKEVPKEARQFNAVVSADYQQVKEIIDEDLSFVFKPINFRYRDGHSERMSALQYALKVYDLFMIKMIWNKINEPDQLEKHPEYVEMFNKAVLEQTTHLDLRPLFDAYDAYEIIRADQFIGGRERARVLDAAFAEIGHAQKKYLPWHMLKEFSREGNTWRMDSHFDATSDQAIPPTDPCRIYNPNGGTVGTWKSLSSIISEWTDGMVLARGTRVPDLKPMYWLPGRLRYADVTDDAMCFKRLFEARQMELAQMCSLLMGNEALKNSP